MSIKITLCSTDKENNENLYIEGLKWSLDRYLGFEESKIRRSIKPMNLDLGNGINIDLMLNQINSNNCFDFDYKPAEKDRLLISNCLNNSEYKYFGLIFREGKWVKGNYYTTRIPYKGIKVIFKEIKEGKLIKTKQEKKIKITNSWTITGLGIIVELENIYNGLQKGTILKSQETELTWTVESRIVETLAIDKITRFPNETETPIHLNFKTVSNLDKTINGIVERDKNRIFQYQIKPNEHKEKPKNGEELLIKEKNATQQWL